MGVVGHPGFVFNDLEETWQTTHRLQRKLGSHKLQPGAPAAVMIKTGERTALAYLTQPLSDSINRAWREQ